MDGAITEASMTLRTTVRELLERERLISQAIWQLVAELYVA